MALSKRQTTKLVMFIIVNIVFIVGFVLNIAYDSAMYNVDQNYVPTWQNSVSSSFITWMNVISYCLTPNYCAGYLALIWLFTNKKMEVLVFILYYVLWIWIVEILKTCIQQPRPFWIQGSQIRMLSWQCQTQYGSPSGHSTNGLIFLQFLVRFTVKNFNKTKVVIWLFYFLMVSTQVLLMFSRVILGVHSLNEVLFGGMLSIYAVVAYYSYIQTLMLRYCMILSMTRRRAFHLIIIITVMLLVWALDIMLLFLPTYPNETLYIDNMKTHPGCDPKLHSSFQYDCFEGTAWIMVIFGTLISLDFISNPQNLTKSLNYSFISWQFVLRYIIWGVAAVIPVGIFILNTAWGEIEVDTYGKTFIKWSTSSVGYFFPPILVFFVAIPICTKLNLQRYGQCEYKQMVTLTIFGERQSKQPQIQMRQSQYVK